MGTAAIDISELFFRLDRHRGPFPAHIAEEVIARKEEVIPEFLKILEDIDNNPDPWLENSERMIHVFAMYFLALFRETSAYPLLVRIFSRPGEFAFDLTGDVVVQDLNRILASVSGSDPAGIMSLIENEEVNEWVRGSALSALVSLVAAGQLSRADVMTYFLQLFTRLKRVAGAQWDGLANACADLWPHEALYELNRAYNDGLVDPWCIAWEDIEIALADGRDACLQRERERDPLIDDVARQMSWMGAFQEQKSDDRRPEDFYPGPFEPVFTIHRTEPKIGRNDPCRCGSGRKFKKCCGVH